MHRILAITGSDPPVIPTAPTPPSTQINSTRAYCARFRSTPKNCARNSAVMPSYRAVPIMLAVAPSAHTKRLMRRGTPNRFSAVSSVVGKVALL
jgi:hypothetical protein